MMISKKLSCPNALILICGSKDVDIPQSMRGRLVVATDTCVAVGTLPESEGETLLRISNEPETRIESEDMPVVFDGEIRVNTGEIVIYTTDLSRVLFLSVVSEAIGMEIRANHLSKPSEVQIRIKE